MMTYQRVSPSFPSESGVVWLFFRLQLYSSARASTCCDGPHICGMHADTRKITIHPEIDSRDDFLHNEGTTRNEEGGIGWISSRPVDGRIAWCVHPPRFRKTRLGNSSEGVCYLACYTVYVVSLSPIVCRQSFRSRHRKRRRPQLLPMQGSCRS